MKLTKKNKKAILVIGIIIAVIILLKVPLPFFTTFNVGNIRIFVENNEVNIKQFDTELWCGSTSNQEIGAYALFVDDEPYYCEEYWYELSMGYFVNIFVCSEKTIKWYKPPINGGEGWYEKGPYSPAWGYDIGTIEKTKLDLKGDHKVTAYVQLCCPNVLRSHTTYYSECVIRKIEKTVDFSAMPGYVILNNKCVEVIEQAKYTSLEECEANLERECTIGETEKKTCPDDSEIIIKECINYEWVETGNICPTIYTGYVIEEGRCEYVAKNPVYATLEKCEEALEKPKINWIHVLIIAGLVFGIFLAIKKLRK